MAQELYNCNSSCSEGTGYPNQPVDAVSGATSNPLIRIYTFEDQANMNKNFTGENVFWQDEDGTWNTWVFPEGPVEFLEASQSMAMANSGQTALEMSEALTALLKGGKKLLVKILSGSVDEIYNAVANTRGSLRLGNNVDDAIKGGSKAEKIVWPPNGGAVAGTEKNVVLTKGYQFDRYGYDGGSYVAPVGTPYEMRSLAPGTEVKPYKVFEVVKPVRGKGSIAAPWFDQPGGGIQFELGSSIEKLLELGRIKEVKP